MPIVCRVLLCSFVVLTLCPPAAPHEPDPRSTLATCDIERIRINLNPWGPHLGFEIEVDGQHPGVAALSALVRQAETSHGHKCANRGAIRFWMADGSMVAVGLLPGHDQGRYQLRFYRGSRLGGVYSVPRDAFMEVLEGLGVPGADPAFSG
jgi:hypothetical protein